MSKEIEQIKLLLKHRYAVRFYMSDGTKCDAIFPRLDQSQLHVTYTRYDDDHLYYKNSTGSDALIYTPSYAVRLLVYSDILRACKKMEYNWNLIAYFDQMGELMIDPPLLEFFTIDEEDVVKESKLAKLMQRSIADNLSDSEVDFIAKEHDIDVGLQIIKTFY